MEEDKSIKEGQEEQKGFFGKYGGQIFLIILIGYIILLGIGVAAEVFKIQWILDWWIFNPPKRQAG